MNESDYFNSFSGERYFDGRESYFMRGDIVHHVLNKPGKLEPCVVLDEYDGEVESGGVWVEHDFDFSCYAADDLIMLDRVDD